GVLTHDLEGHHIAQHELGLTLVGAHLDDSPIATHCQAPLRKSRISVSPLTPERSLSPRSTDGATRSSPCRPWCSRSRAPRTLPAAIRGRQSSARGRLSPP